MSGSSHHPLAGNSKTLNPSSAKPTATNWFVTEIQQMMHGFGDSHRPLMESAILIEQLVHQQITCVLYQAAAVVVSRNARFIGIEDFLFLLRKDKIKLRRFLRYMLMKDKTMAMRTASLDEEENTESGEGKPSQCVKKRTKLCYDFLSTIDQTGELLCLFDDDGIDDIKHQRCLRAEIQSRNMGTSQYIEFCEARQATFSRRYKSQRFKEWVLSGLQMDIKPNVLALETLNYLAYETVAQIVDLSLLVKQDQSVCLENPMLGNLPTQSLNLSAPLLWPESPPSTPTVPNSGSSNHPLSLTDNTASSSSSTTSKKTAKKRKKSGVIGIVEWSSSTSILPADIRECLRRYSHCLQPFSSLNPVFGKRNESKLLCC